MLIRPSEESRRVFESHDFIDGGFGHATVGDDTFVLALGEITGTQQLEGLVDQPLRLFAHVHFGFAAQARARLDESDASVAHQLESVLTLHVHGAEQQRFAHLGHTAEAVGTVTRDTSGDACELARVFVQQR
jgi:hypothetical protein